jgi:hypothetical protein
VLARQGLRNVGTALDNRGKAEGGNERIVTDGPYAESKDLVTGALIIEASSLDDAVEVARQCPTYEFAGRSRCAPCRTRAADPAWATTGMSNRRRSGEHLLIVAKHLLDHNVGRDREHTADRVAVLVDRWQTGPTVP